MNPERSVAVAIALGITRIGTGAQEGAHLLQNRIGYMITGMVDSAGKQGAASRFFKNCQGAETAGLAFHNL